MCYSMTRPLSQMPDVKALAKVLSCARDQGALLERSSCTGTCSGVGQPSTSRDSGSLFGQEVYKAYNPVDGGHHHLPIDGRVWGGQVMRLRVQGSQGPVSND